MLYKEYHEIKQRYREAQQKHDCLIMQKESLFDKTQPTGTRFDKEKIQTSASNETFDNYLIAKEETQIDERIEESKKILEERKYLLQLKEAELRESKNVYDIVYRLRYIDRYKVWQIARNIHYSKQQTYRFLESVKARLKDETK